MEERVDIYLRGFSAHPFEGPTDGLQRVLELSRPRAEALLNELPQYVRLGLEPLEAQRWVAALEAFGGQADMHPHDAGHVTSASGLAPRATDGDAGEATLPNVPVTPPPAGLDSAEARPRAASVDLRSARPSARLVGSVRPPSALPASELDLLSPKRSPSARPGPRVTTLSSQPPPAAAAPSTPERKRHSSGPPPRQTWSVKPTFRPPPPQPITLHITAPRAVAAVAIVALVWALYRNATM